MVYFLDGIDVLFDLFCRKTLFCKARLHGILKILFFKETLLGFKVKRISYLLEPVFLLFPFDLFFLHVDFLCKFSEYVDLSL